MAAHSPHAGIRLTAAGWVRDRRPCRHLLTMLHSGGFTPFITCIVLFVVIKI